MSITNQYVTSNEGETLLGITRQLFFYYVKQGKIQKQPGASERKTLYNRADIMRLRAVLRNEQAPSIMAVDWVKPSDLANTLALDIMVYDEPIIGDFSLYYSWLKKNPHITLAAFDSPERENVLSYITMLPLPEPLILAILRGDRDEKSITADDIEMFERGGEYSLLAESAVVRPGHPEYLGTVMNEFTHHWYELWPIMKIRRIYAQAASDEGLFLVQKLFFAPLYDFPDNAYVLDVGRKNPSRFIRNFQECAQLKEEEYHREIQPTIETISKPDEQWVAREATLSDQEAIYQLESDIYNGGTVPLDLRIKWFKKNPHIDFITLDKGEVVGHFSLLPMTYEHMEPIIKGDRKWPESSKEIQTYQPGKHYTLFVMSAAVKQQTELHVSSWYAALLTRAVQEKLNELAAQDIIISSIYATSRTTQGITFATKLGFDVIQSMSTTKRQVFMLDMMTSESQWARQYREGIKELGSQLS